MEVIHITGVALAGLSLAMSLATYGVFWRDKRSARAGRWRTPERTLLGLCALGGWPGAVLAMRRFRHKTRKPGFIAGVGFGAFVHLAACAALLWGAAGWE